MKELKLNIQIVDERSGIDLITALKTVSGALVYDGDASIQVLLPLASGGYLRVGMTDSDLNDDGVPAIWADRYQGLPIVGGTNIQNGKSF